MNSAPPNPSAREAASEVSLSAMSAALRAKEDAAYEQLQTSLQRQIDTAQTEIMCLESQLVLARGTAKAQITSRLEALDTQREQAYEQLQASLQAQIDHITVELASLEGQANSTASSAVNVSLAARLEVLKAIRDAIQQTRPPGSPREPKH